MSGFFHLPYGGPYKGAYKMQDAALPFIDGSASSV